MKRIFTLFVFVLSVITANSEVIQQTYQISDPIIRSSNGFKTITFDDMILSGKAGEPALPWHAVRILLPPGHEAVRISIAGSDSHRLEGSFRLYPMQHARPLSDARPFAFTINNDLYSSDISYPESATGVLSTHYMNGYSYALSTFTPVQYNPQEGTITYYKTVTVTIETRPSRSAEIALNNLTSDNQIKQRCMTFSQNPGMIRQYPTHRKSSDHYDILIITPGLYTTQIQNLITHYQDQGLESHISTIEYIDSHFSGIDLPEKMRNHIIAEYQNKGISQVILAGDAELIPYRGFYCAAQSSVLYEDANIPSDLYFSGLDGNWNTDGDQLWAEIGEDDLLPDISVGRMSFSNSAELSAMLNKTIKYQNHPVEGELNNHLFAGEFLYDNPETWGSDYLELLIGSHDDNGYFTKGIPDTYSIYKLYDENINWSPSDLINTINSGKTFISHSGHANENYTMKLYNWDITNENFYGVNGVTHNFSIVYTHGCICGAFDVNDCIAERMVAIDNFAAAFVGNSRYGWFNEGQTEGPSAHIQREFTDALFTDSLNRIGSAHLESKIATAPWVNAPGQWEEGALRWCFYDCNVLGDPAMAVWTNEPISIAATYPQLIPIDSSSFHVTVTNEGQSAPGLTVALLKDGVLIGIGHTNGNGIAEVVLDSIMSEPGPAQIKISGFNCKLTAYNTAFIDPDGTSEISMNDILVFPNPATDQININFNNDNHAKRIIMKDIAGKTIIEANYSGIETQVSIPVKGLKQGIYFLHFTGSKTGVVKVIIK
ncbi:MAG TPA: C25 family cysteine peptidase [Lentimicrobium sp.]|nr:C25 family cysteine peptidase [Lentimicrobium sp.]